jgi:streptogramin lyase
VGDVWVANEFTSETQVSASVTELSPNGTLLSGPTGYTGAGLTDPAGIAMDPSGNVWLIDDSSTPALMKLSATGTPLTGSTGISLPYCAGQLAIDGFGNIWCGALTKIDNNGNVLSGSGYTGGGLGYTQSFSIDTSENVWIASGAYASGSVSKFTNAGVPLSGATGYTGNELISYGIANDNAGNAWVASRGLNNSVFKFAPDGTNLSGSNGYKGGGIVDPRAIAVDGAGNVWVTSDVNTNTLPGWVIELNNSGTILSGPDGFDLPTKGYPVGIAVDGSGNVWVIEDGNYIVELVGAAIPVVTPLSVGVKNGTLATRP